ncbi:MAG: dTDP-4-dehydrorhamnose 3,5-epimerase family protein [Patescibacteria group bacterium]|nr:dTDP-4-dehydrorhamnose 3,5-epimerase family protein [Patescibacteria group bacterium]
MINGVVIKEVKKNIDERGWLAEVFRHDETNFQEAMCYVSLTKPGVIRGPHEHVQQADCFVFLGPGAFALHLWDRRPGSATAGEYLKVVVGEDNPSLVIIPPGVVHGYQCISKQPAWCLNFPDKLYGGEGKKEEVDEIRWEKDPNSPYKIE